MKNACAYIRVSTEDQTEYSPDAQLAAIKAYCKTNGYRLLPEYIFADEGKSGRVAKKRPAFMKMIAAAKSTPKPFDVILVHKFDRFARNRTDSVVYKSLLQKEFSISVISVTETIENNKMSIIMESMLDAMAEYYSINLGEEVKKGMTQKAARGEPLTTAPFGYQMVNKRLVPVSAEAEFVRYMFRTFIKTKNYRALAETLNEKGVKTRRGNRFESRAVEYILKNPVYCGYIRWNPAGRTRRNYSHPDLMVVKGTHAPLVSEDVFRAAQDAMYEIKKRYPPHRGKSAEAKTKSHWLTGLVRCGTCGGAMVNSNGYFICNGYVRGKCTERNAIHKDILSEIVLTKLKQDFHETHTFAYTPPKKSATENVETGISHLTLRLARAIDAYLAGVDTLEEYTENKTRLTAALETEKNRLSRLSSDAPAVSFYGQFSCLHPPFGGGASAGLFMKSITYSKQKSQLSIAYFLY